MDTRCILQLCDPDGLTAGEAIALARKVSRVEPGLAPNVCALVGRLSGSRHSDPRAMRRAIEVLCAISDRRSFARACERMMYG